VLSTEGFPTDNAHRVDCGSVFEWTARFVSG
jgi:hypothetical protein